MAKYHKNLKYHKDEVEKHKITKEDIDFLRELQKELNTQDHLSQADPRFWVIKGSEKIYNIEDADGYELYDDNGCSIVASNIEEVFEYIRDNLLDEINELDGVERTLTLEDGIFGQQIVVHWIDDGEECDKELSNYEDVANWLEEFGYDDYRVVSYKIISKIYENTMFLTQKDAEDHLRANDYHYSEDAHTYAMTAWRSPRVEKLVKLLQSIDLDVLNE